MENSKDTKSIEIDTLGNKILLNDKNSIIPQSFFDRFTNVKRDGVIYYFECNSLVDYQNILNQLNRYKINYLESSGAQNFKNNLIADSLPERIKKCAEIKRNPQVLEEDQAFIDFKKTINNETALPLKPMQLISAYHHFVLRTAMDFSVPGSGKTFTSYGLFIYLYVTHKVNKLIVIGPLNSFLAWKNEPEKIFGDKHEFKVFNYNEHKLDWKTVIDESKNKFTIFLFNYEFFQDKNKVNFIANNLLDDKSMVVLDEIHRMKGIDSTRAKSIVNLLKSYFHRPRYILALTGTPSPNEFRDFNNYIELLYPEDVKRYLTPLALVNLNKADKKDTSSTSLRIQEVAWPLYTRTNKEDLGVPKANDDDLTTLCVKPTVAEQKITDLVIAKCKDSFSSFIRQIQASSNPSLLLNAINTSEESNLDILVNDQFQVHQNLTFNSEEQKLIKSIGLSSKTKRTLDFIEEKVAQDKSVIVWCLFVNTIDLVVAKLREKGIKVVRVCGKDNNPEIRNERINDFKAKRVMVLVTNPNTLAESVSLHETCHDAIYLEYGFNLTYLLQSKDRIHRVGLKEGTQTNYYFAITKSLNKFPSIDELIYNRLQEKAKRMYNVIDHKKSSLDDEINEIIKKQSELEK